jgi:hypothetical protein
MKVLGNDYTYLPLVMNYTNAVAGTLIVIPSYLLINRLFRNPAVAFWSVLTLIFAPSFYQSTIMGFPHLIAFFFLLNALFLFVAGLDQDQQRALYARFLLSGISLTIAFLFKSDYVLLSGAFFGILFIRKVKDKKIIAAAIIVILLSGILFLLLRGPMLGVVSSGTTMSKEGLSHWYEYSLSIPLSYDYFIRQAKPIAYGAGIFTFFLGIISLLYFIAKKRLDVTAFIVSWAAVPTVFWMVLIGNNARHNTSTILPIIVLIITLFYTRWPKFVPGLTILLILGNFFIASPSSSILTPSGRLFKSHTMLKERMEKFRSSARQITNINANKIAVLGYFHNPHVIFEIMKSSASYKAVKIGREDYKIVTGYKEFVFLYFAVVRPEDMEKEINYFLGQYDIKDHVFSSATYDLSPLASIGLKTKTVEIIKKSTL